MIAVLPFYSTQVLEYTNFLYWSFAVVAAIILGLVIFFTYRYTTKYKAKSPTDQPQSGSVSHKFEVFALITASLITVFFMFFTVQSMKEIQTIPDDPKPDIIITGHQWWWEAEYPNSKVITSNEVHIPAGKKVLLALNSADVIHSWWVPELGRKIDMIPGMTNYMWMYAEKPGEYLGTCSEFCGMQHARMRIRVIADDEANFKKWQEEQLEPVITEGSALFEKGRNLFEQKTCTNCHAINGTSYNENIGPNLTHFASRKRFLGDFKEVNATNLRAWLHNPQKVKEGAKMPNFILSEQELNALVEYIIHLK